MKNREADRIKSPDSHPGSRCAGHLFIYSAHVAICGLVPLPPLQRGKSAFERRKDKSVRLSQLHREWPCCLPPAPHPRVLSAPRGASAAQETCHSNPPTPEKMQVPMTAICWVCASTEKPYFPVTETRPCAERSLYHKPSPDYRV